MRSLALADALASVAFVVLTGCGAGTAVVASSSGGGGGGNAPPSISGFSVDSPKVPPAMIRFVLGDAESNAATVEFFYQMPGGAPARLTQIAGVPGNPATLSTSPQGIEHALEWNFSAEPGLPSDASFEPGVQVYATVQGGLQEIVAGANAVELGLGNDAPEVTATSIPVAEADGIALVELEVADTSSDVVSVRVEYDVIGDEPDAGWQLARPAQDDATPEYAIADVVASENGTELAFFWNTDVDLAELERDVRLRFTAADSVIEGEPVATEAFRIDNNKEPRLVLREGLWLQNPDQRRGITIPFEAIDDESDAIDVVFQWSRPGEGFPSLPDDAAAVRAILADPALRREHRICSEFPRTVEGRLVPVDATHVRVPELAGSAAQVLGNGIEGLELEILRASVVPEPIASTWKQNPLVAPVAALPVGDGTTALVLDYPASQSWRLREVALATGEIVREIASAATGVPSEMAYEPGEAAVLVTSNFGLPWRVDRVVLASGAIEPLVRADGAHDQGQIRGIACLGSGACLVTVGSSLLRLTYIDVAAPRIVTVMSGLGNPWGVAIDPLHANRAYLAVNGAGGSEGRMLSVDLDTFRATDVVATGPDGSVPGLPRPSFIALDRNGTRLVAACATIASGELRGLDLGHGGNVASVLAPLVGGSSRSFASGRDGLFLLARGDNQLLVGGGVAQKRTITGYDPVGQVIALDRDLSPQPHALDRCRVHDSFRRQRGEPDGQKSTFVWDSADVPSGGEVLVRGVAIDSELGTSSETRAAKFVERFRARRTELGSDGKHGGFAVITADLDGDGDLDLVSNSDVTSSLTLFFQTSPGTFDAEPTLVGGPSVTDSPTSVVAADFDQDGDLDLCSANFFGNNLTIFFQTSPGAFDSEPTVLGDDRTTSGARSVAAADLDQDGDLDLVSANVYNANLTLFHQTSPGVFDPKPTVLARDPIEFEPSDVAAADLDHDGDVDLVVANTCGGNLAIFRQTSPGEFDAEPLTVSSPNINPDSVAVADFDGDGDFDLVSANYAFFFEAASNLTVFFQTSPGEFDPRPTVLGGHQVTDYPRSVTPADLDQDGDLDLVTANLFTSNLTAFFQASPGVFDPKPVVLETNFASGVDAADLDLDGDIDLVSANYDGSNLTIFSQSTAGSYDPEPAILGGAPATISPQFVVAADLDRDGDLDLVSANRESFKSKEFSHNLTVFFQTSPGVFDQDPIMLGDPSVTWGPRCVAAADFDQDGDLDLVAASSYGDYLTVFFQTSPGAFDPEPLLLGGPDVIVTPVFVTAADLDQDGDLDLVSANYDSNDLSVFFQISRGKFDAKPVVLGDESLTHGPLSVQTADFDRDGDLDLVSANHDGNSLTVFFQTSPGTFHPVPTVLSANGPLSVAAADFDQDGDIDIVSTNYWSNDLRVFFQTSPGTFDLQPTVIGGPSITDSPQFVTAADVDQDGDIDLAVTGTFPNDSSLAVFLQTSPGAFDVEPAVLSGFPIDAFPVCVTAADLDLDGDPDLATANAGSNNLTIFWGSH